MGSVNLSIKDKTIEEVSSHKILGVVIDNNLSWLDHVSKVCKTVSKKIYQLSKIKHFLNLHSRKIFFHSYIEAHINYASTIWDGASDNVLKPLSSLYRRALKLILLKSSQLTPQDYKALDILPFRLKLNFNKALFMFKIISGNAPPPLISRFVFNDQRHVHKITLSLPRLDLYKTSLSYSGGALWNAILGKVKTDCTSASFRKNYKKISND